jgi:hypothetical protein
MKNLIVFIIVFGLAAAGYYYYVRKPADMNAVNKDIDTAKTEIIKTTDTGYDTAVSGILKGVNFGATPYYVQNKNYGTSATENICNDTKNSGSIGNIVAGIQKYTRAVTCVAAPDFPSRSFTIVAPSRMNKGKYFCADQSSFAGLIPNLGSPFTEGVRCK